MTRVILQPAGGPSARDHYVDTIESPVSLAAMRERLNPRDTEVLEGIYGSRDIPTWGVTPGTGNVNVPKWERIAPGDVALFAREAKIIASGTVTHVARNEPLADQLWGRDEQDRTWEYMYFLDEIQSQSIPYAAFNAAVGYDVAYRIQGFNILSEERSADFLAAFELDSLTYVPDISDEEFDAVAGLTLDPEEPLDAIGRVMFRKEQAKLRRSLFGDKKTAACGICGRVLPVELLVAAHIKKRSRCTPVERRDIANIVMPMCKLGCDDLFERGFIGVHDGVVVASASPTNDLGDAIDRVQGRMVSAGAASAQYFEWHRTFSFRGEG